MTTALLHFAFVQQVESKTTVCEGASVTSVATHWSLPIFSLLVDRVLLGCASKLLHEVMHRAGNRSPSPITELGI